MAVSAQQPAVGSSVSAPPVVSVPGALVVTAAAAPNASQAEHSGFVVLTRGTEQRRIPYWFRVAAPALAAAQTTPLAKTGTYSGDTRSHPALVDTYRYPEDPRELGVARMLLGPEQVFRVSLSEAGRQLRGGRDRRQQPRPAARRPRGRREPAARRAGAPVQRESVSTRLRSSDARRRRGSARCR